MTAQDLIEKLRRYPVPTMCGVIVVACLLAYYFRSDLTTELEDQQNDVMRQVAQVDFNIGAGANLDDHLAQMRSKSAELEGRIIKQSELANNLKYFYQFESATGVSMADLRQLMATVIKGEKPLYIGVPYSLNLSGTFPQIVSYLNELESGEHFYRLKTFSLSRGRESTHNTVNLVVNLELAGWP
jgi:Tfp pilus assembly protein PilO